MIGVKNIDKPAPVRTDRIRLQRQVAAAVAAEAPGATIDAQMSGKNEKRVLVRFACQYRIATLFVATAAALARICPAQQADPYR